MDDDSCAPTELDTDSSEDEVMLRPDPTGLRPWHGLRITNLLVRVTLSTKAGVIFRVGPPQQIDNEAQMHVDTVVNEALEFGRAYGHDNFKLGLTYMPWQRVRYSDYIGCLPLWCLGPKSNSQDGICEFRKTCKIQHAIQGNRSGIQAL